MMSISTLDNRFNTIRNQIDRKFLRDYGHITYIYEDDFEKDWDTLSQSIIAYFSVKDIGEMDEPLIPTVDQIQEILNTQKRYKKNTILLGHALPVKYNIAWESYKNRLLSKSFDIDKIDEMENSANKILKSLHKGGKNARSLVVGYVQSGKTAHMAGLISLAADQGYNMFIILSGSIENLRVQTETRLSGDLFNVINQYTHNINKRLIPNIYLKSPCSIDAFKPTQINTYPWESTKNWTVVLKNIVRLKGLSNWLNIDRSLKQKMKILVIDDEADQASVNAKINDNEMTSQAEYEKHQKKHQEAMDEAKSQLIELKQKLKQAKTTEKKLEYETQIQELEQAIQECDLDQSEIEVNRTVINKEILKLINDKDFNQIHYVSYTATPYSILLNDTSNESLFPKDGIFLIEPALEYFGAKNIFGRYIKNETERQANLPIVRLISDQEEEEIRNTNIKFNYDGLRDAICWFLCCLAARTIRQENPLSTNITSMLIHTSPWVQDHDFMLDLVHKILQTPSQQLIQHCQNIWDTEKTRFKKLDLIQKIPYFQNLNIKDYEDFSNLKPHILNFISDFGFIKRDKKTTSYSKVSICVDNSFAKKKGVSTRLEYPSSSQNQLGSLGFIVIGGNTLSRGLTLENLVSSYFVRSTNLVDSLMQMARWFGYRRGYELFPRIWMPQETFDSYQKITDIEAKLRDELELSNDLETFLDRGISICMYEGLKLTRDNAKDRNNIHFPFKTHYLGINTQMTFFKKDLNVLKKNKENTVQFLSSLNLKPVKSGFVANSVPFDKIKDYLSKIDYANGNHFFDNLDFYLEWFKNESNLRIEEKLPPFKDWNVIVGGIQSKADHHLFKFGKHSVVKVKRSYKGEEHNRISMKVLRAPSDLFLDIHDQVLKDAHEKFYRQQNILVPKLDVATITNQEIAFIRKEANLDLVPQLFIYCIDQTSECSDNPDFKLQEDLIGLSVFMPKPILDPHVVVHKKSTVMYSIDKHNQLKMTLKKSKEK